MPFILPILGSLISAFAKPSPPSPPAPQPPPPPPELPKEEAPAKVEPEGVVDQEALKARAKRRRSAQTESDLATSLKSSDAQTTTKTLLGE